MTRHMKAGFTLIELLVVIAIIGILAAILFPVFSQVRRRSQETVCLSNMKQVAAALYMYTQDADEYLPPTGTSSTGGSVMNFGAPKARLNFLSALIPLLKTTKVFACPATRPLKDPDYEDYFPTAVSDTNYMGNGAVLGKNICRARAPADIIYIQELYDRENTAWCRPLKIGQPNFYTYWHWTESGREWYACNHREGSNLVFCDGHAEWRHYKALRSGDFGLIPAGDDYKASNGKTYTSAF